MKRKRTFDKSIIFIVLIVIVLSSAGFIIAGQIRTDKIAGAVKQNESLHTMILVNEGDSLVFAQIFLLHPGTGKSALFDVPVNIGTIIPSLRKMERIDFLFDPKKPEPFIEKAESLFQLKIPYHIQTDLDGLSKIIDMVEGIELFIANPVEYLEDDEIILLPSGSLVLDGAKSLLYLRYQEEGESEIEKISRRQRFIQSMLKAFGMRHGLLNNDNVNNYLYSFVRTNLNRTAFISFLRALQLLDSERMVFQRVLGNTRDVDGKMLLFPYYDGRLLKETVEQTAGSLGNVDIVSDRELSVSLEILNGTRVNGLAGRSSQVFKSFGYDVLTVGNADSFDYEHTIVIDRRGDISVAQRVANIIRCSNILSDPGRTDTVLSGNGIEDSFYTGADITIILGKDFDGRYCKN